MRITDFALTVVAIGILCLALAPQCVPARKVLRTDSDDLQVITTPQDEITKRVFYEVTLPLCWGLNWVEQRRLLKSSSKGSKTKPKKKARKWKGGKGAAVGSVAGVVVIVGVLLVVLVVYVVVTERREGDRKWSVRGFFRRKLKAKYGKRKAGKGGEDEGEAKDLDTSDPSAKKVDAAADVK